MEKTEPGLHLTYAQLFEKTEAILGSVLSFNPGYIPDLHEKAHRRGVILLWYTLAQETGVSQERLLRDWLQLHHMVGVPVQDKDNGMPMDVLLPPDGKRRG